MVFYLLGYNNFIIKLYLVWNVDNFIVVILRDLKKYYYVLQIYIIIDIIKITNNWRCNCKCLERQSQRVVQL